MCRRVNSEKPGPLRDRMEAMLYRGHRSVRRGSRSESEVKARTDAEIVFDPGCRVRKLRPQPGDLEGAQSKVAGKLKVHAATHLQSQTVRTVGRPSEAGKTLSKP